MPAREMCSGAIGQLVPVWLGQAAGSVGAHGNVGGVIYLLIYSLSNAQTLFYSMGVTAFICASLCNFFLQEPRSSFAPESIETVTP